ncbi:hypothetical protein JCM1841_005687 [Sporobolomyces salmonicolor]
MGAAASSSASTLLERLQEQLKASAMHSDTGSVRSFCLADDDAPEDDDVLFMPRRGARTRDTSTDSKSSRTDTLASGRAKARPASSYGSPSGPWAVQTSSLAFPSGESLDQRRLPTDSSASSNLPDIDPALSPSPAASHPTPASSPGSAVAATPPRPRSPSRGRAGSLSPKPSRRCPKPSPTPSLRHSLRLPFLPSIPASPLPPILSPGLSRSASLPPVLPAIPCTAQFSPTLELTPPTASLQPTSKTWPTGASSSSPSALSASSLYIQPATSASAPNLTVVASVPADVPSSAPPYLTPPYLTPPNPSPPPILDTLTFDAERLIAPDEYSTVLVADKQKDDRAKGDEKRYHALVELIETESGYLEHLRVLVKVYFQTLPFLTILTVAEVEAVVRNAEALLKLHERIAERLEQVERELGWRHAEEDGETKVNNSSWKVRKAAGRVARVFVDELPNFELYNDFCARHAEALDITRSIVSRPEWEAFERQCAARVASSGSGDLTPVASRSNSASPFFPTATLSPTPPGSYSFPLSSSPQSTSPSSSPTNSTSTLPTQSTLSAASRSKLRFADFAIAPVQRIMRYPLVFGQLAKYCGGAEAGPEHEEVKGACEGFKRVAEAVDEAKREREGEMRTRIVASRMEFQSPISLAFCDVLGPTLLVGALHVLHRSAALEPIRLKYYGCFLYRTHLILAKIKKRASYEPREWLPLRLFEIKAVEEGQGLLSQSIRLSYREHVFELGALCAGEKSIWLDRIVKAQTEARRFWDSQELDEQGNPTLFDDTLVSSVGPTSSAPTPPAGRKHHQRSASSISVSSVFAAPTASNSPVIAQEEPTPALPSDSLFLSAPPLAQVMINPGATLPNRSRFSTTASSLLGRTPSSQRAAVDLRLADVFSEECLAARAQAAREDDLGRRLRTVSGPKRSMTAGISSSSGKTLAAKDRRRLSSVEIELSRGSVADLRGAVGFDANVAALYRNDTGASVSPPTPERKWASAIRKTKSSGARVRPALPEIDTALAEAMGKKNQTEKTPASAAPLSAATTGSWRAKTLNLRRVASQSSLDGPGRGVPPTPLVLRTPTPSPMPKPETMATGLTSGSADVERNNSVSSTSSVGTGTNSSSSHGLQLIETPPSSIPPSPDFATVELVEPFPLMSAGGGSKPPLSAASPSSQSHAPAQQSPRWTSHSLQDGVSNVFKMRRRKSTLGLAPAIASFAPAAGEQVVASGPVAPPPLPHFRSSTVDSTVSASLGSTSNSASNVGGAKLSRRGSTFGGFFQKRVQSSPTLTGFFSSALGSTSSPHLPLPLPLSPTGSHAALESIGGSGSSSPSEGPSAYNTPSSVPTTPEARMVDLPPALPPLPVVSVTDNGTPKSEASPKKKLGLSTKVGRSVSSTLMGRASTHTGGGGGGGGGGARGTGSSPSSTSSLAMSRRFHFHRQNGMTPLS